MKELGDKIQGTGFRMVGNHESVTVLPVLEAAGSRETSVGFQAGTFR